MRILARNQAQGERFLRIAGVAREALILSRHFLRVVDDKYIEGSFTV
jgi:hypothetical protein